MHLFDQHYEKKNFLSEDHIRKETIRAGSGQLLKGKWASGNRSPWNSESVSAVDTQTQTRLSVPALSSKLRSFSNPDTVNCSDDRFPPLQDENADEHRRKWQTRLMKTTKKASSAWQNNDLVTKLREK